MNDWEVQPGDFSFGRYLQRARLTQRIRLDDLSRATCIGIDNLIRLESDDLDHLPAEVFVVGYIRTYTKAVGADTEEALRRYHACRQALKAQAQWELRRDRAIRRFWPRLGLAMCVLAGLIATSVYFLSPVVEPPARELAGPDLFKGPTHPDETGGDSKGNTLGKQTEDQSATIEGPESTEVQRVPVPVTNGHHQYQLDIWAVKDLWLKAIVDDQRAQVYKLKKGDTLHLEAFTGINLLIEDSAGVELTLDGAALPIPGKAGQVVNLEIP